HERNRQSERVDREQEGGSLDASLTGGHGQDRAKNRAHARRPASTEGYANEKRRGNRAGRAGVDLGASGLVEERDVDPPDLMEPEQHQQHTAEANKPEAVLGDEVERS